MKVRFTLNEEEVLLEAAPNEVLLDTLRDRFGLTGTKDVCRTGDCGACTVLRNGEAVHSCLTLTFEVDGQEVVTVEGLSHGMKLSAIQQAFLEEEATHCGFCTPGMIMSATALLRSNPRPTEREVKEALEGNLCRCGTYAHIFKAASRAAELKAKAGGA